MTDPWQEFASRAEGAEVAGYFERAAGHSSRRGLAVWFDRGERLVPLRTPTDLRRVERSCQRHLARSPTSVALGYLTFEAVGLFEPTLARPNFSSPFPHGEFVLTRNPHVRHVPMVRTRRAAVGRRGYARPLSDSLPRRPFLAAVRHLQKAIRDGEAFQVVLAHRREWARPEDLLRRAGRLRSSERFAYFYYLQLGDRTVVGATPESVVEVDGTAARVNPIAGTLPHGTTATRRPLGQDPKELAEHRMLVDLARNDLGRVARTGSVRVLWSERRIRYARLDHLVSRVVCRLRPGLTSWDVLRATFPAGTVCGAPKIRATQWLRREESTWRGPYAGAVGLLRSGNRADWALAIRGGFTAGSRLYTAAGAGIVHRSRSQQEYEETLAKLAHVESTLVAGAS